MNPALYQEVKAALQVKVFHADAAPLAEHEFTVRMFAAMHGVLRARASVILDQAYESGTMGREMRYVPGNKAAMWVYWVKK